MRVSGGSCKGRRLASFKGLAIRPTSDKVREAVFNILAARIPFGSGRVSALDIFAGTGAMGIEALSRGASQAVFVDSSADAVSIINKNLAACGLQDIAMVLKKDAVRAVEDLSKRGVLFDLIFIDPPYETGLAATLLLSIDASGLLLPGGVIVAETSKRAPLMPGLKGLMPIDERRYGDTLIYFYCLRDGDEGR